MSASLIPLTAILALTVAAACGDDDDDDGGNSESSITVTLGADSIDAPAEVAAGLVTVTVVGGEPGTEIDFTRVTAGAAADELEAAIRSATGGGPIPDLLVSNAGVITGSEPSKILLEPGPHFIWVEIFGEDDESEIMMRPLTVTGNAGGELPDTDGSITARDYGFDVDVRAGSTFTFVNNGPQQLHHAVLVAFGDLDPEIVRDHLPALLSEEDGDPPAAFADVEIDFDAGGTAVFSSGLGGTFSADLVSGTTYAVLCFIGDRAGGPPHALAYNMFEVFQVE